MACGEGGAGERKREQGEVEEVGGLRGRVMVTSRDHGAIT